jgi:cell division protein FtsB
MTTPKRDSRLLFILVCSLFLILILTYAGRLARKAQLDIEIARWEAKIEQSKTHQRALESELRYVQSDAYVEKLAHDEFNMVKEGEQLIAVVPVAAATTAEDASIETDVVVVPRWQQWLAQLGLR